MQANNENAKLKAELDKLNKMLEDERQKVEDLMFRNEEENINKEDYNVSTFFDLLKLNIHNCNIDLTNYYFLSEIQRSNGGMYVYSHIAMPFKIYR